MKFSVIRPAELGTSELESWRLMQKATPALQNPFLSPEFTLAVGRARDTARVAILSDGQDIVGFFPHERHGRVVGRAIGAGINDCQGLVHAPDATWDARELVRACRLPIWEFDHLTAGQGPFAPHLTARRASPIIDLAAGYPAYLDGRIAATKGSLRAVQRKLRKLSREVGEVRFEFDAVDADALRRLIAWKSAQYRRTVEFDWFATPWVVQVVTDLLESRATGCTGTLSTLYAGEHLVAAHFGIRSESVLTYWYPAYDVSFGAYSVGSALTLHMAEAAAAGGIGHIDLGKGSGRHKDELSNAELPGGRGARGVLPARRYGPASAVCLRAPRQGRERAPPSATPAPSPAPGPTPRLIADRAASVPLPPPGLVSERCQRTVGVRRRVPIGHLAVPLGGERIAPPARRA